jgi:hypothetical protein
MYRQGSAFKACIQAAAIMNKCSNCSSDILRGFRAPGQLCPKCFRERNKAFQRPLSIPPPKVRKKRRTAEQKANDANAFKEALATPHQELSLFEKWSEPVASLEEAQAVQAIHEKIIAEPGYTARADVAFKACAKGTPEALDEYCRLADTLKSSDQATPPAAPESPPVVTKYKGYQYPLGSCHDITGECTVCGHPVIYLRSSDRCYRCVRKEDKRWKEGQEIKRQIVGKILLEKPPRSECFMQDMDEAEKEADRIIASLGDKKEEFQNFLHGESAMHSGTNGDPL